MPRFFFHTVCGDEVQKDSVGQEFKTESEVLQEARLVAGELVRDAAACNRSLNYILEVSDGGGNIVISFRCCERALANRPIGTAR
jgi:hypothetical protein